MATLKNPTPAQRAVIKAGREANRTARPSPTGVELDDFTKTKMEDPVGLNAEGNVNSE